MREARPLALLGACVVLAATAGLGCTSNDTHARSDADVSADAPKAAATGPSGSPATGGIGSGSGPPGSGGADGRDGGENAGARADASDALHAGAPDRPAASDAPSSEDVPYGPRADTSMPLTTDAQPLVCEPGASCTGTVRCDRGCGIGRGDQTCSCSFGRLSCGYCASADASAGVDSIHAACPVNPDGQACVSNTLQCTRAGQPNCYCVRMGNALVWLCP